LERAANAVDLARIAGKYNKRVRVVKDVRSSLEQAKKAAGTDGMVLATGSIYMLAEMRGKNELHVSM
jgi:folylpolyglutamate synthase/dihydropteroate synthase